MEMELRARYSGVIMRGGVVYAYVYNCLVCATEEECDYRGDVLLSNQDDSRALEECKAKYGGEQS